MFKIANIVYEDNLINHSHVEYINYYNKIISYDNLNSKLPTLFVGRNFLKNSNLDNQLIQTNSILDKKIIDKELYWEFSFNENKSEHISGVEMFTINSPYYYFFSNFEYNNIDPIFSNILTIDELLKLIPISINCTYFYKKEMIYLLSGSNIIGIDINMYNFFDFNTGNLIEEIEKRSTKFINDSNQSIFNKYNNIYSNFNFLRRYLVVLLSKS